MYITIGFVTVIAYIIGAVTFSHLPSKFNPLYFHIASAVMILLVYIVILIEFIKISNVMRKAIVSELILV